MRQLVITKSITNRDGASLDRYLADIGREGLISAEEEVELARRIKAGDKEALEKLTKTNLRFVVSVAKQYQNQGIGLQDLINEGNLGLIKAATRFDETRGFKFISFAVWWIRQAIHQAIADQSRIVRLPQNQVGTINRMKKEIAKLEPYLFKGFVIQVKFAVFDEFAAIGFHSVVCVIVKIVDLCEILTIRSVVIEIRRFEKAVKGFERIG